MGRREERARARGHALRRRAALSLLLSIVAGLAAVFLTAGPAAASYLQFDQNEGQPSDAFRATAYFDYFDASSSFVQNGCINDGALTVTFDGTDITDEPSTTITYNLDSTVVDAMVPVDAAAGAKDVVVTCTVPSETGTATESVNSTYNVSTLVLDPSVGPSGTTVVDGTASFATDGVESGCTRTTDTTDFGYPVLNFDGNAIPFEITSAPLANPTVFRFTVPSTYLGPHSVSFTCHVAWIDGDQSHTVNDSFFVFDPGSAGLTLDPTFGPAGITFQATFQHTRLADAETLENSGCDDADPANDAVLTFGTDTLDKTYVSDSSELSTFEAVVPTGYNGPTDVTVTCTVVLPDGPQQVSATASFDVSDQAPQLILEPSTGDRSSAFDATAYFHINGNDSGCVSTTDPVPVLTFDGTAIAYTMTQATDGTSTTFHANVPADAAFGTSDVTVACNADNGDGSTPSSASAPFDVTGTAPPDTLVLDPNSGPTGTAFDAIARFGNEFFPDDVAKGCQNTVEFPPTLVFGTTEITDYEMTENEGDTTLRAAVPAGYVGGTTVSVTCQVEDSDGTVEDTVSATFRVTTIVTEPPVETTTTTSTTAPPTTTTSTTAPPTTTTSTTAPPSTTTTEVARFFPPIVTTTTPRRVTTTTVPPTTSTTEAEATTTTVVNEDEVAAGPEVKGETEEKTPEVKAENEKRSEMVRAIRTIDDIAIDFKTVSQNFLLAALMILLIAFPSELFNSTLLANYDEVRSWVRLDKFDGFALWLRGLPSGVALMGFAFIGALISSQMSPDFGLNAQSLALVLGLFLALVAFSTIYDILRGAYMNRRFGEANTLTAHPVGLIIALLFVVASRLAKFEPGYLYGLFTALRFRDPPDEKSEGQGLAFTSIAIGLIGFASWMLWIPIDSAASEVGASFSILVVDAALACLWILALSAIAFGLAPMRFMYGEPVKHWNRTAWRLIWGFGIFCFVSLVLHPEQGFYGGSGSASFVSVMILFIAFGVFSVVFWAYFRYRYLWRGTPDETEGAIEHESVG